MIIVTAAPAKTCNKNIMKTEPVKIQRFQDLAGQTGKIFEAIAHIIFFLVDAVWTIPQNLSASQGAV